MTQMTDHDVLALIAEFHVPLHVQRHCQEVSRYAVELGQRCIKAGMKINIELLRHAGLLHDLVRVVDFKKWNPREWGYTVSQQDIAVWEALREKYHGLHHADAAGQILRERGLKEMANVIEHHKFLQIREGFDTWEEKLLYYADKRTKHNKHVSLRERLSDGRSRNAPETANSREAKELDEKVFALEREIQRKIPETLR